MQESKHESIKRRLNELEDMVNCEVFALAMLFGMIVIAALFLGYRISDLEKEIKTMQEQYTKYQLEVVADEIASI